MTIESHRDLVVFQKSFASGCDVSSEVFELSKNKWCLAPPANSRTRETLENYALSFPAGPDIDQYKLLSLPASPARNSPSRSNERDDA